MARLGSAQAFCFDKQMAEIMVSVSVEYIKTMMSNAALGKMVSAAQVVCSELEDVKKLGVEAQEKKAKVEQVQSLLSQLSKIAYAVEDVIDTYVSETGSFMARRLLNYPHAQASKKMRSLHTQVQEVKERLRRCNSEGSSSSSSSSPKRGCVRFKRSNTAKGHVQASDDSVVGIAEEVERLVKELVSRDGGEMDVLGIVGMGGSGKTTLARNLYNHNKVQKHFKHRVWVTPRILWDATCVEPEISPHIGQSKDERPFHNNNSEDVDESAELQELISTNTCLLVLDDVWGWDSLEQIFPKSIVNNITNTKSKIIFTSRHHLQPPSESPSTLLKWHLHQTQLLNEDNSWRLFSTVFTSNNGKELRREHRSLAKEMLIKCEGLPLAIVTLATFLKTKETIHEWEKVYSQLVGKQGPSLYKSVNDILALSYDGLPDYLKPLFLYIGLFRQGPTISAGVLKRLWIAEGFVGPQCRPEETLEKAANRLLQQLIDYTMVQVVKRNYAGKPKTLRIHDIMRDLCITKAKELVFLTVSSSDSSQMSTTDDSRRAAVNLSKRSSLPINSSHLRSLLLYGPVDDNNDKHARIGKQQANLDLDLVCDKFKLLRVLDIKGIKTSDGSMPKEIGSLIHLRYLGIRSTNIQELPKSIGKLRELLTLDYWNVSADHRGITLPNVLSKLQNLRNLYLPQEIRNSKETFKFETMKELQTLWGVRGGNWMLKEMPSLGSKLQKLSIQGISKQKHLESLFESPVIRTYDNLYSLALDWYDIELDSYGLTALCEINQLIKLRLTGKVAQSITLKFPSNLGKLELFFTQICGQDNMEALGTLANLKFLRLAKDSYMEIEWVISRENAFPKLEELKLSNLRNLKKWDMKTEKGIIMPCLKKLSIVSCIDLEGLPEGLKDITGLEILKIKGMPTNFIAKLRKEKNSGVNPRPGGEDYHIVQNIRNIVIQKSYMPLFS